MVRLRGLLVMLVLALLVGGGLLRGQDSVGTPKFKGILPANWGKLGLTDEQKQKIYKVQADYAPKVAALAQQIKDLKDQERTDMAKVLTEAQKTRLKELALGKDAGGDK